MMRSSSSSFPSCSGAMKTQKGGQKRRRGDERDSLLWSVIVNNDDICFAHILPRLNGTDVKFLYGIVNNDDICFAHILPRLNGTDVKFLYGVNSETRKLIKRSSRAGDLKEKFWIEEMSSISTLEFAWEREWLWPREWDATYFCSQVAQTNKNHISATKLLKRINSSCSSGYERRKSVSGMQGRLMRPQDKVIWKWYSIAWRMSVLLMSGRVHGLPVAVISRYSNTYAKKSKRLGIR